MLTRQKIAKAVVPAAGFGTRLLPATKAIPKEMLPVAGKPLIQYAVEEAAAAGIDTVILVTRNHKSLVQAHFARDPLLESFLNYRHLADSAELVHHLEQLADLRFVEQENPLGLAHAIGCARSLVDDQPFAVLLPDVIMVHDEPVTRQLIRAHEQFGGSVIAVREVEPRDVERHGIVRLERPPGLAASKLARVTGLVEKPSLTAAPSRLGVFGRYLLEPAVWYAIGQTHPDAGGEVQLTDALNLLCATNLVSAYCFEGRPYDAGDRLGYLKANVELSLLDSRLRPHLQEYLSRLPV